MKIRILHLEDDPDDVLLIRRTLEGDGIDAEVVVVQTKADFESRLSAGSIDLILSDFALPTFDGLSALELARERAPDVPFILVSGTLGEEAASESVRRGATDYVLKDRLSRLPSAVRRARVEAEERGRTRHAEEALAKERQFLQVMLENLEAGIVACDESGRLTLLNRAGRAMHGLPEGYLPPEAWGSYCGFFHPDGMSPLEKEAIPLRRALLGERLNNEEIVIITRGGPARTVLVSGQPILDVTGGRSLGAVVVMHDITELKKLQEQFQQAQKMEALGRLAGGVAHDFNNLLSVILGYSSMQLSEGSMDAQARSRMEQIQKAGQSAAALTRQLLAFSHKEIAQPRVVDLNGLITNLERLLCRVIGEDVEIRMDPGADLGRIKVDPGQMEQILMNLCVNARDAMPRGGRLTLHTANVMVTPDSTRFAGVPAGPFVLLSVSDTGIGMTPEVASLAFEPFFTTKSKGKGTGLGLSTVYGIVTQAGGHVQIESTPGAGSTFRILIPPTTELSELAESDRDEVGLHGTETILLVEDDVAVRHFAAEALRSFGYTVLTAEAAEEARAQIRSHRGTIHLLAADLILPQTTGRDLAKELIQVRPEMGVLYISGYPDPGSGSPAPGTEGATWLQKPLTPISLASAVRRALKLAPVQSLS